MAKSEPQLDPGRLTHLARIRDDKRAMLRGLSDKHADVRERRADAQRRLALARSQIDLFYGPQRLTAEKQIGNLEAEVASLAAQLAELQAEIDARTEEASDAGRLLRSCLAHAVQAGLTIPASLTAEATDRLVMPVAAGGAA